MKISNIDVNNINYIIGGKNFDNLDIVKEFGMGSIGYILNSNAYTTFSLANFLPNDGFFYEVIVSCVGLSASNLGTYQIEIYSGTVTQQKNTNKCKVLNITPRTANNSRYCGGIGRLIIAPNDRNITIYCSFDSSVNLPGVYFSIYYYRRLGTNNNDVRYKTNTYYQYTGDTDNIYSDGETVRDTDGITKTRYLISETNTQEIARLEREKIGDFAILSTDENTIDYRKLIDGEYASAGIYTKSNTTKNWAVAYRVTN